ncbi:hypothetical protein [Lactococcus protaetiae]|uniref:Uncharacterized protein n=1 Tax=Lactococcus protaetiae TaxID=2592653 RepID=A0A514Z6V0_9LACT|nr:hypothetical protein [Lactococcus protaetiae]QDK70321.1 hypothetical protein FLP15_02995 [Lactococcus protaetiae]
MRKLKLLNESDQLWLERREDIEVQLEVMQTIINANDRVRSMKQPRAQPSESLVQYAKEQSLGEWFDQSPFLAEMKKAHAAT